MLQSSLRDNGTSTSDIACITIPNVKSDGKDMRLHLTVAQAMDSVELRTQYPGKTGISIKPQAKNDFAFSQNLGIPTGTVRISGFIGLPQQEILEKYEHWPYQSARVSFTREITSDIPLKQLQSKKTRKLILAAAKATAKEIDADYLSDLSGLLDYEQERLRALERIENEE